MARKTCVDNHNPVQLAIDVAGGRKKLAESLSPPITRQAVELWLHNGEIPPRRVAEVSKLTGVPKHLLSPLFKKES